jgi:two-component system, OmpR family, sensor histidine kinase KdpD
MSSHAAITPLAVRNTSFQLWLRYLLDTLLACVCTLLITAGIALWHLYPRIPNISIVYLLVIVGLASTRGRYPAILASVVAFLSFDFFIVPPLYTFVIYRVEEWIALFVFLVDALITSQLAVALRQRAEQASRRERETHMLYDLVRLTTREDGLEQQLHTIARTIVDVFSSWGVQDCTILQPDQTGDMSVQASALSAVEQVVLPADEQSTATWAMKHGQMASLYDDPSPSSASWNRFTHKILLHSTATGRVLHCFSIFLPLKMGQQTVGVLRLRALDAMRQFLREGHLEDGHERVNDRTAFFWTFLDQAATLIEQARLRRENLRIEILQRTDALRAALLSSVSHDLRTPLTAIKAAASSLLQEDVQWDDEARHSFASSIEREADRLNRLVGNLLDLSRIEEGALKPEKEWYPLAPLICEVLDRLQPLLQGRTVRTEFPATMPPIELDYLMMDQVLTNLIENAVRYTPATSPIEISVQCNEDEVSIRVADRGPGIPSADLERIFDKFYRVLDKEHTECSATGSGLGLAVCRGIVEAHGGHIWAAAREGGGAVFTMALPVGSTEGVLT